MSVVLVTCDDPVRCFAWMESQKVTNGRHRKVNIHTSYRRLWEREKCSASSLCWLSIAGTDGMATLNGRDQSAGRWGQRIVILGSCSLNKRYGYRMD